ncbi:pentapeptide repeat-containing protein [Leptolyngbya sp. PCC 6406]|uniref:pentapeptide repeat-containing protein n=1 Tax=Leptolyngbya sp. PCC 6406 TaxID=1173264 RepID=UPI0002AC2BD9|nr:pentapeptide repeat-containing protein [Leptolyngbya sp. PCC 6406]
MRLRHVLIATVSLVILLPNEKTTQKLAFTLTRNCPNCLLSWAEFSHLDLRGADLRNANLRGTHFINVDLSDANLSGANLHHARLYGVSLKNANLCGATMMDGVKSSVGCSTP